MERHVNDAVERGAQILIGGKAVPGTALFQPTVLADVPADAVLNSEETFGPLAALCKFETGGRGRAARECDGRRARGVLLLARCRPRVARRGEA